MDWLPSLACLNFSNVIANNLKSHTTAIFCMIQDHALPEILSVYHLME